MAGKVCVVTGATSGIGWETARALAATDATVVLGCRDPARGDAARARILEQDADARLDVRHLDLTRLASVRAFAAEVLAAHPRIHALVNNAGIYTARRVLTEDGFESTFQTNHLGPFLLTDLLAERLRASAPARIVNVASEANQMGRLDFDDPNLARNWSGFRAYCNSKLYNVLHAFELARRLAGTGVTANAMHPGGVRTRWATRGGGWMTLGVWLSRPIQIPPERGADTAVWLASSPEAEGLSGRYFHKRKAIDPNPLARDPANARRLWDLSERLTAEAR